MVWTTVLVLVVIAVAVVGYLLVTGGSDDDPGSVTTESPSTLPQDPATTVPAGTTVPAETVPETLPAETVPPETVPAETVPAETVPPETVAPVDSIDTVGEVVPWVDWSGEPLDATAQQTMIDQRIAEQTPTAAAAAGQVSMLCVGLPVDVPLDVTVVWELDGTEVRAQARTLQPPGVGDCLVGDGGPLAAGAYQVFVTSGDDLGAVTTFVVGAEEIDQTFVNNDDAELCTIGVAPVTTRYYELFVPIGDPLRPGETITITIADVDQDLQVERCDGSLPDATSFVPSGDTVPLVP